MIRTFHADALKFDYSSLGPIDLILSDPPYFNSKTGKGLFASHPIQDAERMMTWFTHVLEKTKARVAFIHTIDEYFVKISKIGWRAFQFPNTPVANSSGKWQTISERDIYAFIAKHIPKPKNKVMLDPFCGSGHILKVAHNVGMDAIGIDNDEDQIAIARKIS